MQIFADTLQLRDVAMATTFWLLKSNFRKVINSPSKVSMGYYFSCMIARDTLFDSRGGFSGTSYPMKT